MAPAQVSKKKLPPFKRPTIVAERNIVEASRAVQQQSLSPVSKHSPRSVAYILEDTPNTAQTKDHATTTSPSPSARFRCIGDFRSVRDIASSKLVIRHDGIDSGSASIRRGKQVSSKSEQQKTPVPSSTYDASTADSPSSISSRRALDVILKASRYSMESNPTLTTIVQHEGLASPENATTFTDHGAESTGHKDSFLKKVGRSRTKPLSAEFIIDSDDSNAEALVAESVAKASRSGKAAGKATVRSGRNVKKPMNMRSAYFAEPHEPSDQATRARSQTTPTLALDLDFQPTMRRRRSWTPPVNNAMLRSDLGVQTAHATNEDGTAAAPFAALVQDFAYALDNVAHTVVGDEGQKRRKVVATPEVTKTKSARSQPQQKVPKPKKKAQTITALATAAYLPAQVQTEHQITIYDAVEKMNVVVDESTGHAEPSKPAKRKNAKKSSVERKSNGKKSTTKKLEVQYGPLIPPSQAHAAFSKQTFVFGTSSQLRGDESPETLEQIHLALQESEFGPPQSSFADEPEQSFTSVPTAPHGTILTNGQSSRNLWSVSARDFDGGYLNKDSQASRNYSVHDIDAEVSSVVQDDEPPQSIYTELDAFDVEPAACMILPSLTSDHMQPVLENVVEPTQQIVMISSDSVTPDDAAHAPARDQSPPHPRRVNITTQPSTTIRRSALQPLDANLGSIAISRRTPTLQVTRSISSQSSSSNEDNVVTDENRPKRGRPRKVPVTSPVQKASKRVRSKESSLKQIKSSPAKVFAVPKSSADVSWHNIDEISDSEAPASSPPRPELSEDEDVALDLIGAELPIVQEVDAEADAILRPTQQLKETDSQWPVVLARLYPQITSTIKATPPSNSLSRPTWHEKILLYDPIVIEDLTAWLKEAGLQVTVKRKRTTKAKKKANNDADYEEVQESLAHWMVQKWCEQNSICCLWKEGTRGGVRTRY